MSEIVEKKRLLILQILKEHNCPLPSNKIEEILQERGVEISERTVRFHLQNLDQRGFTAYKDKKGRYITSKGLVELSRAHVYDQVGFLSSKIDEMTYQMDYDFSTGLGNVLVNVSLIEKKYLQEAASLIIPFFKTSLTMGTMITLFSVGERVGETLIPEGYIGIGTVCSISINAILLSQGIPVESLYAGILEVSEGRPERFTALIRYDGTSLDPLEIFVKARMTSCKYLSETNSGMMGASYREIPASSREEVITINNNLRKSGLSGIIEIGYPGQMLMNIPISYNRCGMIISGGLNAVAVLQESGIDVVSKALSGFVSVEKLFPFQELEKRSLEYLNC